MDQALFQYLLRMGDSTLILSHRLAEWTGRGPAIEEELAVANVALDLLGQARMWLTLAGQVEGESRDEDQLAYLRDAHDYRNYLIVERPNGHYGDTMARQLLFDVWHFFVLRALTESADSRVADVAAKSLKEVAYHARRSADVVVRLGDGTPESHHRMQQSIDDIWPYAGELFVDDAVTLRLAEAGIVPEMAGLLPDWRAHVRDVLNEATLTMPDMDLANRPAHRGGIEGRHTEALGYILAEMQFLQRAYPGAQW